MKMINAVLRWATRITCDHEWMTVTATTVGMVRGQWCVKCGKSESGGGATIPLQDKGWNETKKCGLQGNWCYIHHCYSATCRDFGYPLPAVIPVPEVAR